MRIYIPYNTPHCRPTRLLFCGVYKYNIHVDVEQERVSSLVKDIQVYNAIQASYTFSALSLVQAVLWPYSSVECLGSWRLHLLNALL